MYFPTAAARQLSTVPALPGLAGESVICICPSSRKSLFCTLTKTGLSIWRVRPSAVLAYLHRTSASLTEHGENHSVHWSPDGKRIVIQTTGSYLVLVTPVYSPNETPYKFVPAASTTDRHFLPGPGEALPLQSVSLRFEGVIRIEGQLLSVSPRKEYILFSTKNPPAIQRIPWPAVEEDESELDVASRHRRSWTGYDTWRMNEHELPFLIDPDVNVQSIFYSRAAVLDSWITSDGRAYIAQLQEIDPAAISHSDLGTLDGEGEQAPDGMYVHPRLRHPSTDGTPRVPQWQGTCIYTFEPPRWVQKRRQVDPADNAGGLPYDEPRRATSVAVNARFALVAVGTHGGAVQLAPLPAQGGPAPPVQVLALPAGAVGRRVTGAVRAMEWSSDGYVLAVGWERGWAVWSVGGRCLASAVGVEEQVDEERFLDAFMYGVRGLFWAPGNFELFALAESSPNKVDGQLFVIPFSKSAVTGQHSPDNTRYAFLQMDDRVLVYRGADQPDMSVINPESDVWQHVKIPQEYIATNWPMRYSAISTDGRLIAVAGRRGLGHYSSNSGRWKLFGDEVQEQAFSVRGGLLWFHHVLIAAVEVSRSFQIRLYSRDLELSNKNVLHREILTSPVVILSLVDNSLLVYTADNTLYHYLIIPTADTIKLHLCGSISFEGVIALPSAVRVLSWMIPSAQKQLGDPADDLAVATVLMMVGGNVILLRPHRTANQEVRYDMQILADRIEFCWIHLRGIGALENSLWGYDGKGIRVWLNALAIEAQPAADETLRAPGSVKESVNISLDFYPLSVLMDKGIIIGAEHEAATRSSLPLVLFRHSTSSHLFLHHILLVHLGAGQVKEAVAFARHYQSLVFFAHALEILLHTVVEAEAAPPSPASLTAAVNGLTEELADTGANGQPEDTEAGVLPAVIEFLDHFDEALDVVVRCARKTEMTHWPRLFDVVGSPEDLFEACLATNRLKTAAQYLLVLHNLQRLDENNSDAVRLLRSAVSAKEWTLCRELLRFLRSADDSGATLREALRLTGIIEDEEFADINKV